MIVHDKSACAARRIIGSISGLNNGVRPTVNQFGHCPKHEVGDPRELRVFPPLQPVPADALQLRSWVERHDIPNFSHRTGSVLGVGRKVVTNQPSDGVGIWLPSGVSTTKSLGRSSTRVEMDRRLARETTSFSSVSLVTK